MTIFIGVDAGGTKTAVVVARDNQILSRALGAPGAVRAGRALVAASRITVAVRQALTEAGLLHGDVLLVGAAGVGRDPERSELRDTLRGERLAERVIVTGDLDIALEAGFGQDPGIVIISGTGSVAVARTADGVLHRSGGLGWQMGDEGSGYAIGRAGLIAIGKAKDGRGPESRLLETIPKAAGKDLRELVGWSTSAEPGEVAALAPVVLEAAAAGDVVARAIAEGAADDLAELIKPLVAKFPDKTPVPVALAGGNLDPQRPLRKLVLARLAKLNRVRPVEAPLEPVQGALSLARRA